jgi:hypothetical protein
VKGGWVRAWSGRVRVGCGWEGRSRGAACAREGAWGEGGCQGGLDSRGCVKLHEASAGRLRDSERHKGREGVDGTRQEVVAGRSCTLLACRRGA